MGERHDDLPAFERPIFVAGLPRSGTSMVAGLLAQCGAWVGTTVPGGASNPKGFFEHVVLREKVVKGILKAAGCDPLGVTQLPPMGFCPKLDLTQADGRKASLKDAIGGIIAQDGYDSQSVWLYKDAKLTLLWRLFHREFPHAHWLVVRRDTASFVRSCLNTHFMVQHSSDESFWLQYADEYNRRLDALLASDASVHEVKSEDILNRDYAALAQLAESAGVQFSEQKAGEFVETRHWHH